MSDGKPYSPGVGGTSVGNGVGEGVGAGVGKEKKPPIFVWVRLGLAGLY